MVKMGTFDVVQLQLDCLVTRYIEGPHEGVLVFGVRQTERVPELVRENVREARSFAATCKCRDEHC